VERDLRSGGQHGGNLDRGSSPAWRQQCNMLGDVDAADAADAVGGSRFSELPRFLHPVTMTMAASITDAHNRKEEDGDYSGMNSSSS
jgi:hypothetical protein